MQASSWYGKCLNVTGAPLARACRCGQPACQQGRPGTHDDGAVRAQAGVFHGLPWVFHGFPCSEPVYNERCSAKKGPLEWRPGMEGAHHTVCLKRTCKALDWEIDLNCSNKVDGSCLCAAMPVCLSSPAPAFSFHPVPEQPCPVCRAGPSRRRRWRQ